MEMRQLQIFVALAGELNFTRTAERLNTVQSNVTSQIRNLEEGLGTKLLNRYSRRVTLTEAGTRFLPYAQRVLATVGEARNIVQNGEEPAGPLRIGAPESILAYRLPQALRRFQQHHPHVKLMLRPYIDWPLTQPLQDGEYDLVIRLADSVKEKALGSKRLGRERIFLVAAPKHPLLSAKVVRPSDLAKHLLLLTEDGCAYRKRLERILGSRGVKPQEIAEFTSVEAIKQCALLGMGIALLPEMVVAKEVANRALEILPWKGPDLDMSAHIIWHKERWTTPAMRGFLNIIQETGAYSGT